MSNELAPPKYNVIDRMSVNMASGQLQIAQTDLSIGGDQGISHVVSRHSSEFFGGFNDNFKGFVTRRLFEAGGNASAQFSIVRVNGGGATADFRFTLSGNTYTYQALNDPRNELNYVAGTGLVFTTANGTQYVYSQTFNGSAISSYNPTNGPFLRLTRVLFPTGLQYNVHYKAANGIFEYPPVTSVSTNTGFQLKYQYVDDNRPLDSAKQNSSMETSLPADSLAWSRGNPKQIVALNNSVEVCNVTSTFCTVSNTWPTVTYEWPAGMPRAMAVGQSTFSIIDPEGRRTNYNHTAIDKAIQTGSGYLNNVFPGTQSEPRITSIDLPNSSPINYEYENRLQVVNAQTGIEVGGQGLGYPRWFPDGYAILTKANHDSEIINYDLVRPAQGSDTFNLATGHQAVNRIEHNNQKGVMRVLDLTDKVVRREDTFENKIRDVYDKRTGLYNTVEYDSRLNVTAVKERDADYFGSPSFEITLSEAKYPTSCNTANRKYCNKAEWTEGANGQRTNFTYHAPSGNVATVTSPPDERGIRAQKRYIYVQKTPTHSGIDRSPIWVLDQQRFCRNSAYNGSSCAGNDETVIQYQYETENVLLIGMAVTASGKTLRTCYRYDRFARQIGETQANANRANCNY